MLRSIGAKGQSVAKRLDLSFCLNSPAGLREGWPLGGGLTREGETDAADARDGCGPMPSRWI